MTVNEISGFLSAKLCISVFLIVGLLGTGAAQSYDNLFCSLRVLCHYLFYRVSGRFQQAEESEHYLIMGEFRVLFLLQLQKILTHCPILSSLPSK